MTIYFSKSQKNFYDDTINTTMPSDVKEISEEAHAAIFEGVSKGGSIDFSSGVPVLVPPTDLTAQQYLDGNKLTRDVLLSKASSAMTPFLLALQLGEASDAEIASAKVWRKYVSDVKAVDLRVKEPAWPQQPAI